ncbi:hypothetical protein BaRGS_00005116, partial [Batillaria attramentaria]
AQPLTRREATASNQKWLEAGDWPAVRLRRLLACQMTDVRTLKAEGKQGLIKSAPKLNYLANNLV